MNRVLSKGLRIESKFTDSITSSISLLNGLLEQLGLFLCRIESYLGYQFHNQSRAYLQGLNNREVAFEGTLLLKLRFLPVLKNGVPPPRIKGFR